MKARGRPAAAYGVDPTRREFYSLRQSRYEALAQDLSVLAGIAARSGRKLSVIDVGCGIGITLRYLEAKPHFDNIVFFGADLADSRAYKKELYAKLYIGDLTKGYPNIPSNSFDVVICEQLLEHLAEIGLAIATLARILKPGGSLIVGVPIFPPPLHILRKRLVPVLDMIVRRKRRRGHLQAFSLFSFLDQMRRHSHLELAGVRGFRVISGGILRPLENYRWWWRLNRWLGKRVPALCIEIQAIMRKPPEPAPWLVAPAADLPAHAADCRKKRASHPVPARRERVPAPRSRRRPPFQTVRPRQAYG